MTTFSQARRVNVPLLVGIAGPSGSGKTLSALLLAKGLSGGNPFLLIDTERGRALHYADDFDFLHADLEPPFSPQRYGEALKAAEEIAPPVIVVDSFSHEHAGEGGVLDMHEAELDRLAGQDYKRREAMKFAAWIKPKAAHKRLMQELLQLKTHLIVCLRAEERIDLVKNKQTGKLEVVPKKTLAGHVGWIPVAGKDVPYELTLSLVVTPDRPGVPHPIKLQDQHRALVPLDRPLDEDVGKRLAEWARGGQAKTTDTAPGLSADELTAKLREDQIPDDLFRETAKTLFPGKARPSDLSDHDRAALWVELERVKSPSQREDGNGQAAEEQEPEAEHEASSSSAGADGTSPPADAAFTPPASVDQSHPDVVAANEAAELSMASGKYAGKPLREIADDGEEGTKYIRWLARNWHTEPLKSGVLAFARIYVPEVYEQVAEKQEHAA